MNELFQDSETPSTAYRVLARKYRPATFEELIGQEAMVRTLSNAIEAGRLPHAWMLTGVRGIGKTTTARLIARALNCAGSKGKNEGPTIHPCGKCDACKAIAEDRHVDVQEMDAASRTGVDDIRDIIDGVRYGPVSARYKIYILDEVHMLSKNAFNALLKTLEEPPPHVKFIFATTEIRKVPVTVLSRCQRFDLRRIDSAMLTQHFMNIVAKEKAKAEPEAIKLIAHAADGSVRDGLSLLDQAISRGNGKVIESDVKDMLGLADRGKSLVLCRQLLRGEMAAALGTYDALQQVGTDPLQVLQDLAELIHELTRAQIITDYAASPDVPEADRAMLKDLSDIKVPALARAWQILLKGIGEVQYASNPVHAAEMVLIRLAYASELPTPADLVKQLRDQATAAPTSAPSSMPKGGAASRGSVALAHAQEVAPAQATPMTQPVASSQPMPSTFHEVVALFAANREGGLHAQLANFVHVVRCEPCRLEVRLEPGASTNLINRVSHFLNLWTGQRWMVSVVEQPGAPTLAEEEKAAEEAHQARVRSHPLMKAVMTAFPSAKIIALKPKEVVLESPVYEDKETDDETLMPNEETEET